MATIHDIRRQAPRTNGTRSLSQIKYIARHHSATTDGDFFAFWKTWNGVKGWGTGGYHEIILRDGSVQLCYDPEEITNGVANHNTPTYHICVVGNGSFTAAQEATFKERCLYNMKRLNVPADRVLGHKEFSGASTACPGIDMNLVRASLKGGVVQVSSPRKDYLIMGDTESGVGTLQTKLNKVGFKLSVDNIFGAGTENAVKAFQRSNGLVEDGIAGKVTLAKLDTIIANIEKKPVASKPVAKAESANEGLPLPQWQREELAAIYRKARESDVFSSEEHEHAILEGTMPIEQMIFLQSLIAGAALNGGKRIKV